MTASVSVLGIAGSLRRGSYNRALIRAAQELAPPSLTIEPYLLDAVPLFNGDVEAVGDPTAVTDLKNRIRSADAILIATPEYQHGVPGVLKNALDWASRPAAASALHHKVVGIMGASPGIGGTARAQSQLRQTLVFNDARIIGPPEVLVRNATEVFDSELRLTDAATRGFVSGLLERLTAAVEEQRRLAPVAA